MTTAPEIPDPQPVTDAPGDGQVADDFDGQYVTAKATDSDAPPAVDPARAEPCQTDPSTVVPGSDD